MPAILPIILQLIALAAQTTPEIVAMIQSATSNTPLTPDQMDKLAADELTAYNELVAAINNYTGS